ncbi:hypothetical protein B7463_g1971, partial [Scytalidium lignicola]
MAANPQYNFPPPPPPPGPYAPSYTQQPPRGGGGSRGSGRSGRGDFHAFNPHAGYNPQGPPPVAYGPQNPPPYAGPQGPSGNYPPPQWGHEQHGPPQPGPMQHPQQHPQSIHQPPPPIPLSAQNYHPNYAPQSYGQPPQYGPQQPPQPYQQPPQPSYGPQVPMSHQPQMGPPQGGMPLQQWSGPPQHPQPQYNNAGRGRGRGGFNSGRGGHEAPLMGPPIRMGFDNDRSGDQIAQAGNGFAPQYPNAHQSSPVPFSQPQYQSYPPQNFTHGGQRPPLDPNPYNSTPHNRGGGRGGSNFRGRGRGDHFRHRPHDRHNRLNGNSGSPAPAHKSAGAENDARNKKKNKKRKTNTLGLTPNGPDHEDSEEDDIDEEVRLVNLLGPDTPQLPTDIAAWIAERKARYPTKARREAAAEELRKRQQTNGASAANDADATSKKSSAGESKLERQQRKAEKLRLQLEKAEQKIKDAMNAGSKRKRETGDNGDGDDGDDDESSDDSDSGSDDSKPEVASSHVSILSQVAAAPKAQLQRHCKYFSTGGTCGKKGKCRFVHDQEVRNQALREKEANGGVMTLAQRLILNDTAKDDLTILKSIKYLKEKGLMSDHQNASAKNVDGSVLAAQVQQHQNDLAMRSRSNSHPDSSASSKDLHIKSEEDDHIKTESIDDGEV